jgi:hypothetical protein
LPRPCARCRVCWPGACTPLPETCLDCLTLHALEADRFMPPCSVICFIYHCLCVPQGLFFCFCAPSQSKDACTLTLNQGQSPRFCYRFNHAALWQRSRSYQYLFDLISSFSKVRASTFLVIAPSTRRNLLSCLATPVCARLQC